MGNEVILFRKLLFSSALVQTSLLLMFFVIFKLFSGTFGFSVGGKTVSTGGEGGFRGAWDFFTICKTTFLTLGSLLFASLVGFGPPGSGVVGLFLKGRSGSKGLSSRLMEGFAEDRRSTPRLRFNFNLDEDSCVVAVLGLFLVIGLVSALPILLVSSIDCVEVAGWTALLRELKVALKKFAENLLLLASGERELLG